MFYDVIENFDLVHFCHNIIYCISDKYGYQKIENSNGFIDFQQRFHSNIDKFIIYCTLLKYFFFQIVFLSIYILIFLNILLLVKKNYKLILVIFLNNFLLTHQYLPILI